MGSAEEGEKPKAGKTVREFGWKNDRVKVKENLESDFEEKSGKNQKENKDRVCGRHRERSQDRNRRIERKKEKQSTAEKRKRPCKNLPNLLS